MNKRQIILGMHQLLGENKMKSIWLMLGAIFSLATLPVATAAEQPNLIIILSDDAGYGDHSVHGHPRINTPNIDHLSTQSVRFTDYHVNTICSPTRAELMTGVTAYRNGSSTAISGLNVARIDLPMMPQYFKDNGYATAQIGKWHLLMKTGLSGRKVQEQLAKT